MPEADPHPRPNRFVGLECSFDGPDGKRLSGWILTQDFIGYTERGRLPNYRLKVQGLSGATQEVDLVEQHISLK